MSEREKLKTGDVAAFAAGPGRTKAQATSRFTHWRELGIIPASEQVWGPGGPAYVYPQTVAAIFAVVSDLFDAGVVTGTRQLRSMWRFFSEPHAEGVRAHITHVLDAIAAGECVFLIMTMWRDEVSGEFHPTCATRFEDEYDRPVAAPAPHHEPIAEYVINLHVLLKRFATTESNVRPIRAEG
ncbi:MAG: hypothetical protein Q8R82_05925 [Hyphomonadaceae bacterium]|nr:hypothetical protein [Hyphomonadaceae bacterium]